MRQYADDRAMVNLFNARKGYAMASRRGSQKRRRSGVPSHGAGADYHYRGDNDWLWMSELAWDLYRNDPIVGSIADRAVEQTLQGGIGYDPDTGDTGLDRFLKSWWDEITIDPRQCSSDHELDFGQQEEIVLRTTLMAGDLFALPLDDGTVDLVEGHLCRSPSRSVRERPVHGVEFVPGTRRRAAYWFLKDNTDPFRTNINKGDLSPYPAWTDDGERNVWHVRFPKRATQTRGITALAPIFDTASYHADLQFLQMVKARAQSLFAFIRSRSTEFNPAYLAAESKMGRDATADRAKRAEEEFLSNERQYSAIGAGSVISSLPGETVTMANSNTPNAEFFEHYKTLLTFVGVNLGMPLVMALMDASHTNFSGFRGAVDQARIGFRKNQKRLIRNFHAPYRRFKLLRLADEDDAVRKALEKTENRRSKVDLFGGQWQPPAWPYLEPGKDAAADLLRTANSLSSPRRIARERGADIETLFAETIADNERGFDRACEAASRLIDKHGLQVDAWTLAQHLLPRPTSERTSMTIQASPASSEPEPEPGTEPKEDE